MNWLKALIGFFFPRDAQAYAERKADASGEDLSVHESVVDILKALGQPSDLGHRRNLALEWGRHNYSGTAEENIWLHQEILRRVAARTFP
jgi:hypothetical protein